MPQIKTQSVLQNWRKLAQSGVIEADGAQERLCVRLDGLINELERKRLSSKSSSLGWMFGRNAKPEAVRGLYIHGSVGRGKSMLMDMFFAASGEPAKRRVHFNAFMQDAHARINAHRKALKAGLTREEDPIPPVAAALAAEAQLLCFDEFSVTDIADAMILGRLFSALFRHGVTVVATSNVALQDLYRDGLNRQLFLPFIALFQQRLDMFELDSRTDFRLEKQGRHNAYLSPTGERSRLAMEALWSAKAAGTETKPDAIGLRGRSLTPHRQADGAAWFSFSQLCSEARGTEDYLAVAAQFDTVFLDGVPMMDLSRRNEAKRFILLIDTLYDAHVQLVVSADANPHALYQASTGAEMFEFARTASRLIEMQSLEYEKAAGEARSTAAGNRKKTHMDQ